MSSLCSTPSPASPVSPRHERCWRAWYPLWIALAVYVLFVLCTTLSAMHQTGGRLIYALDDTYIHLAIVKNFVHHGLWGVTPYEFSAASSSPLWVLLLAMLSLFAGSREQLPFLLNLLIGGVLPAAAFLTLRRMQLPAWYQGSILTLLVVVTPLAPLVMSGMEHLLHATLLLFFVACLLQALEREDTPQRGRASRWALMLTPLLVLVRFESLFFLGIVSILLLLTKRRRLGVAMAVLTIAPLLITGIIQRAHGGFWLPNSVINKTPILYAGPAHAIGTLLRKCADQLLNCPEVAWMLLAVIIVLIAGRLRRRREAWTPGQLVALCYILTSIIHLTFAKIGWLYRYEAYLVVFGIIVLAREAYWTLGPNLREIRQLTARRQQRTVAFCALLCILCAICLYSLGQRAVGGHIAALRATRHVYLQQYQMGRFLSTYYMHRGVFANDIGAISYLADIHLLDYWGLGTTDMITARLRHQPLFQVVDTLAQQRDVRIAFFYESYVLQDHPATWVRIGLLHMGIKDCYWNSPDVAIYAATPAEVLPLVSHLCDFAPRLPVGANFLLDNRLLDSRNDLSAEAIKRILQARKHRAVP